MSEASVLNFEDSNSASTLNTTSTTKTSRKSTASK